MNIDRARPADARAAADIYLQARAAAAPGMPAGIHSDADVRAHVAEVRIPKQEVWLARVDAVPVGLLVLDGAELNWLFVAPGAQSQGIGSALLEHAKQRRPDGLALWTFVSNTAAQRFYERRGFHEVARTDGADNEEGAPDIRWVWAGFTPSGGP